MVPVLLLLLRLLIDVALQRQLARPLLLALAVLNEALSREERVLCARAGAGVADVVVAQPLELAGRTRVVLVGEEGGQGRVVRDRIVVGGGAGEFIRLLQLGRGFAAVLDGGRGLFGNAGKRVHEGAAVP